VGAYGDDCATGSNCGAAYVFALGLDCNSNNVPDDCDIADCAGDPVCADCNANGIPDGCDLASGTSADCNANGIPDECESPLTLCDDDVPCTIDSCDEANQGCVHLPDAVVCGDGLFCNGVEICDPVVGCRPGTPPNCDDSVGCTIDACNQVTDRCTHAQDDSACNDGNACNGLETCDPASGCRPGSPPICDDGLFCNGAEICDPILGCLDQPDPCDATQTCYEDKDDCFDNTIPTVSEWGLVILTLLLLTSGKVAFGRKGADRALNNQM
jgi:hypothetical protein